MALPVKCNKGHSYIQADVYPLDWPEDAPRCPECLKIWMVENGVDKMPSFSNDEGPTWDTARFEAQEWLGEYEVVCVDFPDITICTCYDNILGTSKKMAEKISGLLNVIGIVGIAGVYRSDGAI